jgi:hypothetical protein
MTHTPLVPSTQAATDPELGSCGSCRLERGKNRGWVGEQDDTRVSSGDESGCEREVKVLCRTFFYKQASERTSGRTERRADRRMLALTHLCGVLRLGAKQSVDHRGHWTVASRTLLGREMIGLAILPILMVDVLSPFRLGLGRYSECV